MVPRPGISYDSEHACKFKKVLYSLKQSSRAWFEKFVIMISFILFVF
jgi:hypothetical protein